VAFSTDGEALVTGDIEGVLRIWDVATGRLLLRLPEGPDGSVIRSVAFSPDGRVVAAAGDDSVVWLWNPTSGGLVGALRGHVNGINALAFAPDGTLLATASEDTTALLWEVNGLHRGHR
jgi:WD40 repeat protein